MLVLTRKTDESITIGSNIKISILEVKGNQIKLGIQAPKDIPINRTEIYERIMEENINASNSHIELDLLSNILQLKTDM